MTHVRLILLVPAVLVPVVVLLAVILLAVYSGGSDTEYWEGTIAGDGPWLKIAGEPGECSGRSGYKSVLSANPSDPVTAVRQPTSVGDGGTVTAVDGEGIVHTYVVWLANPKNAENPWEDTEGPDAECTLPPNKEPVIAQVVITEVYKNPDGEGWVCKNARLNNREVYQPRLSPPDTKEYQAV
jgi:hypothetical protein